MGFEMQYSEGVRNAYDYLSEHLDMDLEPFDTIKEGNIQFYASKEKGMNRIGSEEDHIWYVVTLSNFDYNLKDSIEAAAETIDEKPEINNVDTPHAQVTGQISDLNDAQDFHLFYENVNELLES
ncbi:MAG: hypothetical protein V5A72_01705 [Candidatus Nanohaloarchaea archaeon]